MSDTASSLDVFNEIKVLAQVDHQQASILARQTNLIVKTREGYHGVLSGVDWLGNPKIEVDQYTRTWRHLKFTDIEATGYTAVPR